VRGRGEGRARIRQAGGGWDGVRGTGIIRKKGGKRIGDEVGGV